MYILFEEEAAFKAGSVLADNDSSLQVEMPSGKRIKIKAANVLLRYASPSPNELLSAAHALAQSIEVEFLWDCAGDAEFLFSELADEYFGHQASPVEASALLLSLHSAPIYFHRKAKGRFRKAPPEIVQAALAGLEKKRQLALSIARMSEEFKAGKLPESLTGKANQALLDQLLYKADRNRPETKALEQACQESGLSAPALLKQCAAFRSPHDYHLRRFLLDYFPTGSDFPELESPAVKADNAELAFADVQAFSIDDASTTEIDDAFSVQTLADGAGWRV
ncbi:MAG: RNB domain-containing ribonuclease, partial [Pseudomonadota bacterium]